MRTDPRSILPLTLLVPLLLTCAHAPPVVSSRPILPDFQADPSAHVWDGRYWIYPSHDLAGSKDWDMVDWHAFSSTDLVHWTDHGAIFSLKDITWAKRWAWAPDCMKRNGRYYFYYPADDQIGVAVSDKPDGPFVDPLGRPLIARGESGTRVMDPAIFVDDDGQAYLYFGQNELRVVKLGRDMITRDGSIQKIPLTHFHEGIWMHKRNGLYYLSYCSVAGDGRLKNRLEYATATSPLGPFTHRGVFFDNHSRNVHHSIVEMGGEWFLFYHVEGPSWYERRVCVDRLHYNPDGTIQTVVMTKEGVGPIAPPAPAETR
jgi:arabinoxylan arabinofuranohydrolase